MSDRNHPDLASVSGKGESYGSRVVGLLGGLGSTEDARTVAGGAVAGPASSSRLVAEGPGFSRQPKCRRSRHDHLLQRQYRRSQGCDVVAPQYSLEPGWDDSGFQRHAPGPNSWYPTLLPLLWIYWNPLAAAGHWHGCCLSPQSAGLACYWRTNGKIPGHDSSGHTHISAGLCAALQPRRFWQLALCHGGC